MTATPQHGNCYDYPAYYELAFSFRDLSHEADVITETIARYARTEVRDVLNLACGPSPHLPELARRALRFHGLDLNAHMLAHSQRKAHNAGAQASFTRQSMVDFTLATPVDYVFIALGDLYVRRTDELKTHLASVARALRPGGLFLLDWCIQFEPAAMFKPEGEHWHVTQGDVAVQCHVTMQPTDPLQQLFEEQFSMQVQHGATALHLASPSIKRAVYPQEFLTLIDSLGTLEFIGWWNNWDLSQPLSGASRNLFRPITLLRRRI